MALVIHELTTNAAKYGALADSGTVDLSWEIERESGDLVIDWRERDGPEVREPGHRGFGSTIIERSIPYDLGGTARVDFHRQGLHARFTLPARSIAGVAAARAHGALPIRAEGGCTPLAGKDALLVEDSMIIALDGEEALRDLGARSVTTVPSVRDALRMIDERMTGEGLFDFALLDYNLGVTTSAPIADRLAELGVRFAFATGYGEGLDTRAWGDVPVITKPYGLKELRMAMARLGFVSGSGPE